MRGRQGFYFLWIVCLSYAVMWLLKAVNALVAVLSCLYISGLNSSLLRVSKLAPFSLFSRHPLGKYFFWSHSVQYGSFLNEDWHQWDYGFAFSPPECELQSFAGMMDVYLVCMDTSTLYPKHIVNSLSTTSLF